MPLRMVRMVQRLGRVELSSACMWPNHTFTYKSFASWEADADEKGSQPVVDVRVGVGTWNYFQRLIHHCFCCIVKWKPMFFLCRPVSLMMMKKWWTLLSSKPNFVKHTVRC